MFAFSLGYLTSQQCVCLCGGGVAWKQDVVLILVCLCVGSMASKQDVVLLFICFLFFLFVCLLVA